MQYSFPLCGESKASRLSVSGARVVLTMQQNNTISAYDTMKKSKKQVKFGVFL